MSSHQKQDEEVNLQFIFKLQDQLREVLRKLEVIELAIVGDTKHGIEGITKRMDRSEKEIAELKAWKARFTRRLAYTCGAVSGAVFGGIEGIAKLLQSLHHTP